MIIFIVTLNKESNARVICSALNREEAKRKAHRWFGSVENYDQRPQYGNPDHYIVTPLTAPDDRVHLDITVQI